MAAPTFAEYSVFAEVMPPLPLYWSLMELRRSRRAQPRANGMTRNQGMDCETGMIQ
jgi:hypothetical protein